MIKESEKKLIQKALGEFVAQYPTQVKAAAMLKGVGETVVINVKKDKWENISDDMWRKIAKQIGYSSTGSWSVAETTPLKTITAFFEDAREYQNTFAIVAPAGTGKTVAAKLYSSNNENVFHVQCSEYLNRKAFLTKLLESMGVPVNGSVYFMMETVVDHITKLENPLFILDEADKLSDQVLYFFISLYNFLQDKCGIVLLSTDYLEARIEKGRRLNKKGYNEIFSRIGRRYINVKKTTDQDVSSICVKNGINDDQEITRISNSYEGDLRRVEREVHRYKRIQESKTPA